MELQPKRLTWKRNGFSFTSKASCDKIWVRWTWQNNKNRLSVSEDTCYEYGKAGEAGAGEVVHKTDETGETRYAYGKLNEVIEEERTIKRGRDFQKPVTASFKYKVDYLGRMQTITYPDGETVTPEIVKVLGSET